LSFAILYYSIQLLYFDLIAGDILFVWTSSSQLLNSYLVSIYLRLQFFSMLFVSNHIIDLLQNHFIQSLNLLAPFYEFYPQLLIFIL
jgi:hypothetical protein